MILSLAEAARRLGKSERQVRYLIGCGDIPARKAGGRWVIDSASLPLSEGQRQAVDRKERQLRSTVEESLGLGAEARSRYSVRDLKAFQLGLPLWRKATAKFGSENPAALALRRMLVLLSLGCHRFEAREKTSAYSEARDAASLAVCELLLMEGEAQESFIAEIEQELMAALSGLLRRLDGKGRR